MSLSDEDKKRIEEEEKYRASIRKESEKKKGMGVGKGCLLLVLIFFGFIVIVTVIGSQSTPKDANTSKGSTSPSTSMAGVIAKSFVKQSLKSPSTAEFPWLDIKSVDLGSGRFKVSSYVDSQNGFGAQIRSNWIVVLKHKGGSESDIRNWELEDIQIK